MNTDVDGRCEGVMVRASRGAGRKAGGAMTPSRRPSVEVVFAAREQPRVPATRQDPLGL